MNYLMTREEFEHFKKAFSPERNLPETTIDVTGTVLSPGKPDICNGNGRTFDKNGDLIECCCDECDYLMACFDVDFNKLTYEDYINQQGVDSI